MHGPETNATARLFTGCDQRRNFVAKFAPLLSPGRPTTEGFHEIDDALWGWCWQCIRWDTCRSPVFQHVDTSTSPPRLGELVKVQGLQKAADTLGLDVPKLVLAMTKQCARQHPETYGPACRVIHMPSADVNGIVPLPSSSTVSDANHCQLASGDVCIWVATSAEPLLLPQWPTDHARQFQLLSLSAVRASTCEMNSCSFCEWLAAPEQAVSSAHTPSASNVSH